MEHQSFVIEVFFWAPVPTLTLWMTSSLPPLWLKDTQVATIDQDFRKFGDGALETEWLGASKSPTFARIRQIWATRPALKNTFLD